MAKRPANDRTASYALCRLRVGSPQTLPTVSVDTRGLRGGAIEWTADNHYRQRAYYKVYRWDTGSRAVVPVGGWTRLDVK